MFSGLRPRSMYDVCSAIACVAALAGGTAYAAATITGADVVNESLPGTDVKNSSLAGADIANGSITHWDVADGSITGADVKESTLNLTPVVTAVTAAATSGDPCAVSPAATGRFCGSNSSVTTAWRNYGAGFQPAGFYKDALGVVHLQGSVAAGQGFGSIFVLPVGYRPASSRLFGVFDDAAGSKYGYVKVLPDGQVTYADSWTTGTGYLSLEGITLRP